MSLCSLRSLWLTFRVVRVFPAIVLFVPYRGTTGFTPYLLNSICASVTAVLLVGYRYQIPSVTARLCCPEVFYCLESQYSVHPRLNPAPVNKCLCVLCVLCGSIRVYLCSSVVKKFSCGSCLSWLKICVYPSSSRIAGLRVLPHIFLIQSLLVWPRYFLKYLYQIPPVTDRLCCPEVFYCLEPQYFVHPRLNPGPVEGWTARQEPRPTSAFFSFFAVQSVFICVHLW